MERSYGAVYERLLLESFLRHPTGHTAWMLNRLINRTDVASIRVQYVEAMARALSHPLADGFTVQRVRGFLSPE